MSGHRNAPGIGGRQASEERDKGKYAHLKYQNSGDIRKLFLRLMEQEGDRGRETTADPSFLLQV